MEVYTCTTRDLKEKPYIARWHTMSKRWLKYHTLASDLISQQARGLLQSPVDSPIRLNILDEWMCRTIWGVHSWVNHDLARLHNALKVDIFNKANETKISESNFFLME